MTCKPCLERGKTWEGSDPICAFDGNISDNWNCATIGKIRDLCGFWGDNEYGIPVHHREDTNLAVIDVFDVPFSESDEPYMWLIVQWYKNRGATENMFFTDTEGQVHCPKEEELIAVYEHYKKADTRISKEK